MEREGGAGRNGGRRNCSQDVMCERGINSKSIPGQSGYTPLYSFHAYLALYVVQLINNIIILFPDITIVCWVLFSLPTSTHNIYEY